MLENNGDARGAAPAIALDDIVITPQLASRRMRSPNVAAEREGLQSLALMMPEGEEVVFRGLAKLAIDLCRAASSGVSVPEALPSGEVVFRWKVLAGLVASYEGGTTPRGWSPCGTCLDRGQPTLYAHPEWHFTYLQSLGFPIVEALVVPMLGHGENGATIWICSHEESRRFDAEDVRIMLSLGSYAANALRLSRTDFAPSAPARAERESSWQAYLAQIAAGDPAGLAALFNDTSPLVFSTAMRIVGFPEDAEEVTADVYARIWTLSGGYRAERGSVASWLRTIARNIAFDRLRAAASRSKREVSLRTDCCGATNLEDDLIANQARERVSSALAALPSEQRQTVELAYLSGMTCPEIAKVTRQPVGTVKTRLRLALIKLRRLLAARA